MWRRRGEDAGLWLTNTLLRIPWGDRTGAPQGAGENSHNLPQGIFVSILKIIQEFN